MDGATATSTATAGGVRIAGLVLLMRAATEYGRWRGTGGWTRAVLLEGEEDSGANAGTGGGPAEEVRWWRCVVKIMRGEAGGRAPLTHCLICVYDAVVRCCVELLTNGAA